MEFLKYLYINNWPHPFGFAAVASGNDLESDVIAFNRNTGMLRQKGAQTNARPITTSINPPKKTLKIRA